MRKIELQQERPQDIRWIQPSLRDGGRWADGPSVETQGYFQLSLREKQCDQPLLVLQPVTNEPPAPSPRPSPPMGERGTRRVPT